MPAQSHPANLGQLPSEDEIKEDPRACYQIVRRRIDELTSAGQSVPETLRSIERVIQVECMAQSQGR